MQRLLVYPQRLYQKSVSLAYNRRQLMITLLFILVFLLCQTFILLCCVAAGNDAASQEISDQEQMEFINEWKKTHTS